MKKTERIFSVYNEDESTLYGSFQDMESAQKWVDKISSVVADDLKIKESSLVMELPEGISFSTEQEGFMLNPKFTPLQNLNLFIEWAYENLRGSMSNNYEGLVALEVVKSIVSMSNMMRDSEEKNLDEMDEKLKASHKRFLEAGKIFGIDFMLKHTYDFWRNQDEKDKLVDHYYRQMLKEKSK
jgi:flagellar biosynthesis regulator FlaF